MLSGLEPIEAVTRGDMIDSPVRCLAIAVIYQSIRDRAGEWLLGPENASTFELWSDLAEVAPASFRRRAREFGLTPEHPDYLLRLALRNNPPGRPRKYPLAS